MKTKDIVDLLDDFSSILREYPDLELKTALKVIKQTLRTTSIRTSMDPDNSTSHRPSTEPITASAPVTSAVTTAVSKPQHLPRELESVPTEQLHAFLQASDAWKVKSSLQALATQLGVVHKARHTKAELLDLIVNHITSRRTHSAIRSYQPEHAGV